MNDTSNNENSMENRKNFPITTEQINDVMKVFYAKIRVHPNLGPIFNGVIGNIEDGPDTWDFHEEKVSLFWQNVLRGEGDFTTNLMAAHMPLTEIKDEHFTQWLELFDSVLFELLPEETAKLFSAKAHTIGGGLRRTIGIMNDL